jgi:hypothetical protein
MAHNILKFIFCIYLFIFKSVELALPILKHRRLETHNTSDAIETLRCLKGVFYTFKILYFIRTTLHKLETKEIFSCNFFTQL